MGHGSAQTNINGGVTRKSKIGEASNPRAVNFSADALSKFARLGKRTIDAGAALGGGVYTQPISRGADGLHTAVFPALVSSAIPEQFAVQKGGDTDDRGLCATNDTQSVSTTVSLDSELASPDEQVSVLVAEDERSSFGCGGLVDSVVYEAPPQQESSLNQQQKILSLDKSVRDKFETLNKGQLARVGMKQVDFSGLRDYLVSGKNDPAVMATLAKMASNGQYLRGVDGFRADQRDPFEDKLNEFKCDDRRKGEAERKQAIENRQKTRADISADQK